MYSAYLVHLYCMSDSHIDKFVQAILHHTIMYHNLNSHIMYYNAIGNINAEIVYSALSIVSLCEVMQFNMMMN